MVVLGGSGVVLGYCSGWFWVVLRCSRWFWVVLSWLCVVLTWFWVLLGGSGGSGCFWVVLGGSGWFCVDL